MSKNNGYILVDALVAVFITAIITSITVQIIHFSYQSEQIKEQTKTEINEAYEYALWNQICQECEVSTTADPFS